MGITEDTALADGGPVSAPFTLEQVRSLNDYQRSGFFHPFTCPRRTELPHRENPVDVGLLVATVDGWICPDCQYTQSWAHPEMTDRTWERLAGSHVPAATRVVNDRVCVARDGVAGRCVRARVDIAAGELVERCPVIVVPEQEVDSVDATVLFDFYYQWPNGAAAFALGYGSMYNHSDAPNADYVKDAAAETVEIVAVRDIAAGDEVLVDYTRGGSNPLWFDPL